MKTRIIVAIISTIGLLLMLFMFPTFWLWYLGHFDLHTDSGSLIVPTFGSIIFFAICVVVVVYSWARSFDSNMK